MESREIRFRPDWPSRVLAIFSLVVAGLAVGYAVMQGQIAVTQQSLVDQFDRQLQQQLDLRRPQWDDLLAEVRSTTSELRSQAEQELRRAVAAGEQQMQTAITQHVEQLTAAAVAQDQRIASLEDQLQSVQAARVPVSAPVELTYRATENDSCVRLHNRGSQEVIVDALRFVPQQVEETRALNLDPFVADEGESVASDTAVVFAEDENLTTAAGAHGEYRHQLSEPIRLQPGEQVLLRLAIRNSDHQGWALVGDLVLDGDDAELYRVRMVAAPFVAR